MDFSKLDATTVIDMFLLLLIGIGPKIALVPFVELTSKLTPAQKARVITKMLTTAATVALLLIVFGGLLTKLLHFSTGSLSIASGIILVIISIKMVLSDQPDTKPTPDTGQDIMKLAVFPLSVPYLLNPVGIVALVTASAEAATLTILAVVLLLLVLVLVIDVAVFRTAGKVSRHLDPSRMLVTEKIFGFLLTALGVQLILDGLNTLGVITLHLPH
jgi:small neutral amino acid transporter SnatA (MarC family)